jgi:uncharacterized protein
MKIDIAEAVRSEGEVFSTVYNGPLESIDFMGENFEFPAAHVEAEYRFDGEGVIVSGSFSSDVEARCSRCLKAFRYPVEFEFNEYYSKNPQEDEGTYAYTADVIELDTMLQDNIIAGLPMRFLCGEDCKGLCSVCGRDLNEGECGCERQITDSRLSDLAGLNSRVPKKP